MCISLFLSHFYLLYLCSPGFSFILVLCSLLNPTGSNNKHSRHDFLQAAQLKGQGASTAREQCISLTLTSTNPWKIVQKDTSREECHLKLTSVVNVNEQDWVKIQYTAGPHMVSDSGHSWKLVCQQLTCLQSPECQLVSALYLLQSYSLCSQHTF